MKVADLKQRDPVGPIRRGLGISDFGMSLLQGWTIALFFSVMALPIGYLGAQNVPEAVYGGARRGRSALTSRMNDMAVEAPWWNDWALPLVGWPSGWASG